MSERATGSCVCGEVKWAVTGPYRFFQYCHCSRCRKRTGSAHAANLAVPHTQVSWLAGDDAVTRFELSTARAWGNAFCSRCGSGVPWLTRNGKAYIVPAGGLDAPPEHGPTRNVHFASRANWYEHATNLPIFEEDPT